MKIILVTPFREYVGGGMGIIAYEVARNLSIRGNRVILICPGNKKTALVTKSPNLRYLTIKSAGKDESTIPALGLGALSFIFKKLESFSPDIIHSHDIGPLALVAQFWAIKTKVPFVYSTHMLPTKTVDFGLTEFVTKGKGIVKIIDKNFIQKYCKSFFSSCDALFALNAAAEKDIKKLGYRGKVQVVPNGCDLGVYSIIRRDAAGSSKNLLFVGFISRRKNQEYLIEMMKYLPRDYVLNLVGRPFDEKCLRQLKKRADVLKVNVNFIGEVPFEKVIDYLARANLFVSASKMEVQSLVILEALASGLPVVGLDNETIEQLIDDSCGKKLAKNTRPPVFAKAVESVLSLSREDYLKLSQAARKKVEYFGWDNVVGLMTTAYKQVISEKGIAESHEQRMKDESDFLERLSDWLDGKKMVKAGPKNVPFWYLPLVVIVLPVVRLLLAMTGTRGKPNIKMQRSNLKS